MKNIFIASDHAGFELKKKLIFEICATEKYKISDLGTDSTESCDYPIFANRVVKKLEMYDDSYGVLICGTGIGMSITANRFPSVRAALCFDENMAEMARKHNNVIVFGARIISSDMALSSLYRFLETDFEGGRHSRRLKMINELVYGGNQ